MLSTWSPRYARAKTYEADEEKSTAFASESYCFNAPAQCRFSTVLADIHIAPVAFVFDYVHVYILFRQL
jgi:hypothetical protein